MYLKKKTEKQNNTLRYLVDLKTIKNRKIKTIGKMKLENIVINVHFLTVIIF
jgi:hypothetical protein